MKHNGGKVTSENYFLLMSNTWLENVILKFGEKNITENSKRLSLRLIGLQFEDYKKMFVLFQGRAECRYWLLWKNFPNKLIAAKHQAVIHRRALNFEAKSSLGTHFNFMKIIRWLKKKIVNGEIFGILLQILKKALNFSNSNFFLFQSVTEDKIWPLRTYWSD